MDNVTIISSDCHAGALPEAFRDYLDASYRDDYDDWIAEKTVERAALRKQIEEMSKPRTENSAAEDDDTDEEPWAPMAEYGSDERTKFGLDIGSRLSFLEKDGIVAEVLFPESQAQGDIGMPFVGGFGSADSWSSQHGTAGYRAYNRWLADTIEDHNRQLGIGFLSYDDPQATANEIHWARNAGLKGVQLDGIHPDFPPLFDECFDPMWQACVDEGLPIHFHAGTGMLAARRAIGRATGANEDEIAALGGGNSLVQLIEQATFDRRPFAYLVNGGVCERFPELKIVFTEVGFSWATRILTASDWAWEHGFGGDLPLKPSEYCQRQVYFGASNTPKWELEQRHDIGVANIMWGTDHPHPGGPFGEAIAYIRATFGAAGVPETEARAMLGGNAARLYGLDLAKLDAIAEKVGPTAEDALRPPDATELVSPLLRTMVDSPVRN